MSTLVEYSCSRARLVYCATFVLRSTLLLVRKEKREKAFHQVTNLELALSVVRPTSSLLEVYEEQHTIVY